MGAAANVDIKQKHSPSTVVSSPAHPVWPQQPAGGGL